MIEDEVARISLFSQVHKRSRVVGVSEECSVEVSSASSCTWNRFSESRAIFADIDITVSEIAARFDSRVVGTASVLDVEVSLISAIEFLRALDDCMVVVGTVGVLFSTGVDVGHSFGRYEVRVERGMRKIG